MIISLLIITLSMLFLINIELIGPLSLEFFLFPVLKLENICLLHLPSSSLQFSIFSWKNNSSVISLHTLHTPSSTELVVTFVELKSCNIPRVSDHFLSCNPSEGAEPFCWHLCTAQPECYLLVEDDENQKVVKRICPLFVLS